MHAVVELAVLLKSFLPVMIQKLIGGVIVVFVLISVSAVFVDSHVPSSYWTYVNIVCSNSRWVGAFVGVLPPPTTRLVSGI